MRVWSSNPLAFNCGAALYSLQRATEAAKPYSESARSYSPPAGERARFCPSRPKPTAALQEI